MGDRACVIFHDTYGISPTAYLHWHGDQVPEILRELAGYMTGRYGDAEYAAARFVGLCHRRIGGTLSLGIMRNDLCLADLADAAALEALSPGDAGLVAVDTGDFTWTAHGGYLAAPHPGPAASPLTLVKPSTPND